MRSSIPAAFHESHSQAWTDDAWHRCALDFLRVTGQPCDDRSLSGCTALANAQVDVWHCDAAGVYSDASDPSFNTKGQKFLRGYQLTDANGKASFTTIYPGWYGGRAVHIHFKIRTTNGSQVSDFTSQLFFDDSLNSEVFAQAPYNEKTGSFLRNAQDGIYTGGGDKLLLKPTKSGSSYTATFDIGLA